MPSAERHWDLVVERVVACGGQTGESAELRLEIMHARAIIQENGRDSFVRFGSLLWLGRMPAEKSSTHVIRVGKSRAGKALVALAVC